MSLSGPGYAGSNQLKYFPFDQTVDRRSGLRIDCCRDFCYFRHAVPRSFLKAFIFMLISSFSSGVHFFNMISRIFAFCASVALWPSRLGFSQTRASSEPSVKQKIRLFPSTVIFSILSSTAFSSKFSVPSTSAIRVFSRSSRRAIPSRPVRQRQARFPFPVSFRTWRT